jgi:outer membrane protein insertion porin family
MKNQLRLNPDRLASLADTFPQSNFGNGVIVEGATTKVRASTGLELQIMMPVVNAPFRLYWAYNPLRVNETLQPPVVADRSLFPNDATFQSFLNIRTVAAPFRYSERQKIFRFTISRTF